MDSEKIWAFAEAAAEISLNHNAAFEGFLSRFAASVRNATLEEAAVVCEEMADRARTSTGAARADACADKIRSMK